MEVRLGSTIARMQKTTDWIFQKEMEGYDNKVENGHDEWDYGCGEPSWKIKFVDFMDKGWGVKSSP